MVLCRPWTSTDRGLARAEKKEFDQALADYDQAIRLNPQFDDAYLSRAWLLATCPDSRYRDPSKAVELATKACELTGWHGARDLGALAAVYAETGNVPAAVKWQSRSIELMTGGRTGLIEPVQLLHP
jgi:tetratricopeptide (TPR) repeat protein